MPTNVLMKMQAFVKKITAMEQKLNIIDKNSEKINLLKETPVTNISHSANRNPILITGSIFALTGLVTLGFFVYKKIWSKDNLGSLILDKNLFDEKAKKMLTHLNRYLINNPDDTKLLCFKAKILHLLNLNEKALALCNKIIVIDSQLAESYLIKGITLKSLGRFNQALDAANAALSINSKYALAYCLKGKILVNLNQNDEALTTFDKAISSDSNLIEPHFFKGMLLAKLGQHESALIEYNHALNSAALKFYLINLNKLVEKSDFLKATNLLSVIYAYLNPIDIYAAKIRSLIALKHHEKALKVCDKALYIDPKYIEIYFHKAHAATILNNIEGALAIYDVILRIDPNNAECYKRKAKLLLEIEDRAEEALKLCNEALRINLNFYEGYIVKGEVLEYLERNIEALKAYDEAIARNPNNGEAYSYKGSCLVRLSCVLEGLAAMGKAISINPNRAELYFRKSEVCKDLGRDIEAQELYEIALQLKKNSTNTPINSINLNIAKSN